MAYGFYLLTKSKKFRKTSIKTKATAIDSILKKGRNGVCYQVSFEFQDTHGQNIKSQYNSNKNIKSGSEINILYSKTDSNNNKVENFSSLYLTPILFIIFGPLILIAASSSISS